MNTTEQTKRRVSFDNIARIWLEWPSEFGRYSFDGDEAGSFKTFLNETTKRNFSHSDMQRMRRYIRKTYGGTRGF